MAKLWSLEFNIFIMVAVGFLIRRIQLVGKEAERVITDLVLYVVLPVTAVLVLRKNTLREQPDAGLDRRRTTLIAAAVSLGVGVYDGFYGPGTGTFLIVLFSLLAKLDVRKANGLCKAVNLTTNVTSLIVFLRGGQVLVVLGLAAAACNMLGNYIGSGMAIKSGVKITRPIIIFVLVLLLLRVAGVY